MVTDIGKVVNFYHTECIYILVDEDPAFNLYISTAPDLSGPGFYLKGQATVAVFGNYFHFATPGALSSLRVA